MSWPHGYDAIVAFYGNPDDNGTLSREWYSTEMTTVTLPPGMYLVPEWSQHDKIRAFAIHTKCKDSMERILTNIWNTCRIEAKKKWKDAPHGQETAFYDEKTMIVLQSYGLHIFGGSFNFRKIRGRTNLSLHSFGVAVDWAPGTNALGKTSTTLPKWFIQIFKNEGWVWGGDFNGRKDPMHLQAASGY